MSAVVESSVTIELSERELNHVLVLIAMESEAQPLLSHLSLSPIDSNIAFSPFKIYSGKYKDITISVVTNGKDAKLGVDNVGTVAGLNFHT